jgi:membrane-associated phospholipid phosphatase
MKAKPAIHRPRILRRTSNEVVSQVALATLGAGGVALLARTLRFDSPPAVDVEIRRVAQSGAGPQLARAMKPLFPLGLPGGYLTIAYATALWLDRNRRPGGPAIVTSAWLGWIVHRAIKVFYFRERPMARGKPYRTDSYPSGHTTGATALALTTALVLRRQKLISPVAAALIGIGAPTLMAAYRILADDHWATDVAGGWMLGVAIGLTCDALLADVVGGAAHVAMVRVLRSRRQRRPVRRERPSYAT